MNAAQLKASILQQAIEGKLVPQLAEEGVAEQIGDAPSEVPYEIPTSWKWVKINSICKLQAGKFIKASEICESGTYPCYGANGVRGSVEIYNYDGEYILIGRVGAQCGNIHVTNGKMYVTDNAIVVDFNKSLIDQKLLALFLKAFNLRKLATATAQPLLTSKRIEKLILPLPPFEEQKRIVAKIEELMPLVEEYGKAYDKLQELNDELPDKLKASILQEAIQGKLVPQLPEDGVVEQIGTAPEEVPFELPASWCWSVLKDIANVKGGKRVPAGKKLVPHDTGYPYIRVSDMQNGSVNLDSILYLTEETRLQIKNYTISCKDVYVTVAGTIGRVGTVPKELDGANLTENADKIVLNNNGLLRDWVLCFLKSEFCQQEFKAKTTKVGQPKLAIKRIENICIPIPPLAEQKRIVAKIEALFEQIDLMTK